MAAALTVFQLMSVISIYSADTVQELGLEWNKKWLYFPWRKCTHSFFNS